MIALVILVCVLVGVNLALFYKPVHQDKSSLFKKTVILNTKDGQSLKGVLTVVHADRYTLSNAVYLHQDGKESLIDGQAHVPTSNLAFIQEVNQ